MGERSVARETGKGLDRLSRFAAVTSDITSPWIWTIGSLVGVGAATASLWWGFAAVLCFGVIPALLLLLLLRRGYVSDWRVTLRHERAAAIGAVAVPLLCGLGAFVHWNAPPVILSASIAGVILLIVQSAVTLVLKWKISIHSSVGALCSTFIVTALHPGMMPSTLLVIWATLGGWSRCRLRAHTVGQVVAGGMAGIVIGGFFGST